MKHFIGVNQKRVVEAALEQETDFNDWAIIYYLWGWQSRSKKTEKVIFDGEEYFWIKFNQILKEMPLLPIQSKQGISKRIEKYRSEPLGLIKTHQPKTGGKLYFRLTPLALAVVDPHDSDEIPNKEGDKVADDTSEDRQPQVMGEEKPSTTGDTLQNKASTPVDGVSTSVDGLKTELSTPVDGVSTPVDGIHYNINVGTNLQKKDETEEETVACILSEKAPVFSEAFLAFCQNYPFGKGRLNRERAAEVWNRKVLTSDDVSRMDFSLRNMASYMRANPGLKPLPAHEWLEDWEKWESPTRPESFEGYDEEVRLVLDEVLEIMSKRHPDRVFTQKDRELGMEAIHKLLVNDRYETGKILKAARQAVSDDFWAQHFLTPAKLAMSNKDNVKYIDVFLALKSGRKSTKERYHHGKKPANSDGRPW